MATHRYMYMYMYVCKVHNYSRGEGSLFYVHVRLRKMRPPLAFIEAIFGVGFPIC